VFVLQSGAVQPRIFYKMLFERGLKEYIYSVHFTAFLAHYLKFCVHVDQRAFEFCS